MAKELKTTITADQLEELQGKVESLVNKMVGAASVGHQDMVIEASIQISKEFESILDDLWSFGV